MRFLGTVEIQGFEVVDAGSGQDVLSKGLDVALGLLGAMVLAFSHACLPEKKHGRLSKQEFPW